MDVELERFFAGKWVELGTSSAAGGASNYTLRVLNTDPATVLAFASDGRVNRSGAVRDGRLYLWGVVGMRMVRTSGVDLIHWTNGIAWTRQRATATSWAVSSVSLPPLATAAIAPDHCPQI